MGADFLPMASNSEGLDEFYSHSASQKVAFTSVDKQLNFDTYRNSFTYYEQYNGLNRNNSDWVK
jgi:hypothetical protein